MQRISELYEMLDTELPADIDDRFERISQALHGLPPNVQGAIIGELLAMWLAGHVVAGGPTAGVRVRKTQTQEQKQSDKLRAVLLRNHIAYVKTRIEACERDVLKVLHSIAH